MISFMVAVSKQTIGSTHRPLVQQLVTENLHMAGPLDVAGTNTPFPSRPSATTMDLAAFAPPS
jgi:hypothetical protein